MAALCSVLIHADCSLVDSSNPVCMTSYVDMQHCVAYVHSILSLSRCLTELRVLGGSL